MKEWRLARRALTYLWWEPGPWPRLVRRLACRVLCWFANYAPAEPLNAALVAELKGRGLKIVQRGMNVKVFGGRAHDVYQFGGAWSFPEAPQDDSADRMLRRILRYERAAG